ncbi:hypothetical protein [Kitasatospora sp. NBC_00039]|uniref:hypothetical protein n=1 Tax=Kitasatospora sp. NBC_00039 TaxID=2903565 RepID=UPI002F91BCB7
MNERPAVGVRVPPGRLTARLYPDLQLRSSGFPAARLLPAPPAGAGREAHAAIRAARRLAACREDFRTTVFPALKDRFPGLERADRNRIVRSSRLVGRGAPLPEETTALLEALGQGTWAKDWTTAVTAADTADHAARLAYLEAVDAVLGQVRARLGQTRVHQAIGQSSSGFAERLFRPGGAVHGSGPLRAGGRHDLMTAHRYLRRLATRCETVSFFGPSCFARLAPDLDVALRLDPPTAERTAVDASAWLVRELAKLTAPRGGDVLVGRDPLWRVEDGALVRTADGRSVPLTPQAAALWEALDGRRPIRESARTAGLSAERLRTALTTIRPAVRRGPLVASTERHALRALVEALPEPGAAGALLGRLERVAAAPWPEREAVLAEAAEALDAAGLATARRGGEHYADRSFWHEERSSPYSERVRLGAPTLARLSAVVTAVLEPLYLAALLARMDARDTVRAAFGGRRVPLAHAATADLSTASTRREELRRALVDLVDRTPAGPDGAVRLTSAAVAQACRPFWSRISASDLAPSAALPGLDLLAVGASPAAATWVLGEVHDDSSSVLGGSSTRVHTDPERLYADFCAAVSRLVDPGTMAGVVSRRRSMHITPELPGLALELSGVSGRPHDTVAPVAHATVSADGTAIEVDGVRRWLYPGDLSSTLHRALSLPCVVPVDLAGPTGSPRVLIDDVVVTRASWHVPCPDGAEPGYLHWSGWQQTRHAHGLPRRIFVRHPAETKPIFVDLDDPVAVDDLARLGPGTVRISECLPDLDALWWRPDGEAQVAELRIACLIDVEGWTT